MAVGVRVDDIYTLGSPRVGDTKFHQWFTRMMDGRFVSRITHNKDSVPHFPLESEGFQHLHTEVFYNKESTSYRKCNISGEDKLCSDQYERDTDIKDHLDYFKMDFERDIRDCRDL